MEREGRVGRKRKEWREGEREDLFIMIIARWALIRLTSVGISSKRLGLGRGNLNSYKESITTTTVNSNRWLTSPSTLSNLIYKSGSVGGLGIGCVCKAFKNGWTSSLWNEVILIN